MGVILPVVERDGIFPQFFRGIGTGREFFFYRKKKINNWPVIDHKNSC